MLMELAVVSSVNQLHQQQQQHMPGQKCHTAVINTAVAFKPEADFKLWSPHQ
jgi:hypothetical protein